ncbi:MAG: cyclin-domain-containing protein [Benjaminiella poitrasii]|nr:MAG: cyclin-domain-containing protein [Benjaminiella poitrasii]
MTAANNCSLQTDPDLYALRNKKCHPKLKPLHIVNRPCPQQEMAHANHLLSTNRLAYVEALVDITAVVIESIWYSTNTTTYTTATTTTSIQRESRVSPVVPLRTFIQEVLKRSRTTYSTLQTALFYLFRARPGIIQHLQQQRACDKKTSWQHNAYISCGRRMFLASLVVASKFVQDKTYRNSAWAKIAGLSVTEINTAERYFLNLLDYRLYIDQTTFDRWHCLLHVRTQARMHNIPTSLQDLAFLSFAPLSSYPSSPISACSPQNDLSSFSSSFLSTPPLSTPSPSLSSICSNNCICSQCSPISIPPALSLSLPSSISSSPAKTPIQISPVRTKRKHDSKEHTALLDKKHCRFWQ